MDDLLYRYIPEARLLWVASTGCNSGGSTQIANRVADTLGASIVKTLTLEEMESASFLRLQLPFFSNEQLGAAYRYGPMSLATILSFTRELRTLFADNKTGVISCCCSRKDGSVANTVLLIGAYLILERGASAVDVARKFCSSDPAGSLSIREMRFPTPFKKIAMVTDVSLTLQDCFLGLQEARDRGWVDWHRGVRSSATILAYDAVPIFDIRMAGTADNPKPKPIMFWVAADPCTTVVDPQVDLEDDITESRSLNVGTHASVATQISTWTQRFQAVKTRAIGKSALPTKKHIDVAEVERPNDLADFAKWLHQEIRCALIVRTNYSDEPGLPERGSYGVFFHKRRITQLECPFEDGCPPPEAVVISVLKEMTQLIEDIGSQKPTSSRSPSVVIHCKSGLGRSMSLLGAVALAFSPGLSGSAYFGWSRLVRPGSIQAGVQEEYLRAFDIIDEKPGGCLGCLAKGKRSRADVRQIHALQSQAVRAPPESQ